MCCSSLTQSTLQAQTSPPTHWR
uniref:Uncharacterized protein n=1 Tax=Anguilla anguilla TaxID=7936 RepID=A0A0E9VMB3_ANGAN